MYVDTVACNVTRTNVSGIAGTYGAGKNMGTPSLEYENDGAVGGGCYHLALATFLVLVRTNVYDR